MQTDTDIKEQIYQIINDIVALNGNCTKEDYLRIKNAHPISMPALEKMQISGRPVIVGLKRGEIECGASVVWNFLQGTVILDGHKFDNAAYTADLIQADNAGKIWLSLNEDIINWDRSSEMELD